MTYEVLFDEEALKFLEKQELIIRKRIFTKIINSKEEPHRAYIRLEGRQDHKLRVGNYRVIADIDDSKKKILITLIGHRKNIYK